MKQEQNCVTCYRTSYIKNIIWRFAKMQQKKEEVISKIKYKFPFFLRTFLHITMKWLLNQILINLSLAALVLLYSSLLSIFISAALIITVLMVDLYIHIS